MYNRYVPQSDGSFQRCRISEEPRKQESSHRDAAPKAPEPESCPPPKPIPKRCIRQNHRPGKQEPQGGNVLQFLRHLLPRDFDTGDLLVVILLLLMSGDCQEDQNTALLTLALYLFM